MSGCVSVGVLHIMERTYFIELLHELDLPKTDVVQAVVKKQLAACSCFRTGVAARSFCHAPCFTGFAARYHA